jgi:hypothetical protein
MTTGYHVDAENRRITATDYQDTDDIRDLVGGSFCFGFRLGSNVLYALDNGLYSKSPGFFRLAGTPPDQPIRGNALLVGPETPDGCDQAPRITLAEFQARIEFLSWDEACAWATARADQPAITINGRIVMTWGELWNGLPPPATAGGQS